MRKLFKTSKCCFGTDHNRICASYAKVWGLSSHAALHLQGFLRGVERVPCRHRGAP